MLVAHEALRQRERGPPPLAPHRVPPQPPREQAERGQRDDRRREGDQRPVRVAAVARQAHGAIGVVEVQVGLAQLAVRPGEPQLAAAEVGSQVRKMHDYEASLEDLFLVIMERLGHDVKSSDELLEGSI